MPIWQQQFLLSAQNMPHFITNCVSWNMTFVFRNHPVPLGGWLSHHSGQWNPVLLPAWAFNWYYCLFLILQSFFIFLENLVSPENIILKLNKVVSQEFFSINLESRHGVRITLIYVPYDFPSSVCPWESLPYHWAAYFSVREINCLPCPV